jgi:hypothetical protein
MQFKSYLEQLRESNPEAYNQIYTELYDKVYSNVVDDLTHEMVQLDSSYIEDDFSDLDTTLYDGLENEPTFDVDVTDDYIFEDMYHSDEKVPSIVAEVFVVTFLPELISKLKYNGFNMILNKSSVDESDIQEMIKIQQLSMMQKLIYLVIDFENKVFYLNEYKDQVDESVSLNNNSIISRLYEKNTSNNHNFFNNM